MTRVPFVGWTCLWHALCILTQSNYPDTLSYQMCGDIWAIQLRSGGNGSRSPMRPGTRPDHGIQLEGGNLALFGQTTISRRVVDREVDQRRRRWLAFVVGERLGRFNSLPGWLTR